MRKINYRKELTRDMDWQEVLEIMAEENERAMEILSEIENFGDVMEIVQIMDDMNVRGEQIEWMTEHYCENKVSIFVENVKERNSMMIHKWNHKFQRTQKPMAVSYGAVGARINLILL